MTLECFDLRHQPMEQVVLAFWMRWREGFNNYKSSKHKPFRKEGQVRRQFVRPSNVADVCENSSSWWDQVKNVVQGVYTTWSKSTPLERVQLRLDGAEHLAEGKWGRLNARVCPLLLASMEESIKKDLIAHQATRSATAILMRLFVLYRAGGAAQRATVMFRMQLVRSSLRWMGNQPWSKFASTRSTSNRSWSTLEHPVGLPLRD